MPRPPPNINFHLPSFFSISSPSLFKKKIFAGGGYHLAKKIHSPPPSNIHFHLIFLSISSLSLFQFFIFFIFFYRGGVYHMADSSSLKKIYNPPPPPNIHFHLLLLSFFFWGGYHLANSSSLKKFTIIPPPQTSIFIFLLFLSISSPSLFKKKFFFFKPPAQLIPPQKKFTILPPLKHPVSSSFSFYLFLHFSK